VYSGSPLITSVAEPHRFEADPDLAFHCLCGSGSYHSFSPVLNPLVLQNEPLGFHLNFNADPDSAFHFDSDPDPDPTFNSEDPDLTFPFDADPDLDLAFQFDADPDPSTHIF
jgi:hypothetical protein